MTIMIGGKPHPTRRPADLDAKLIASTGCASSEIETVLRAGNSHAAHALRPFLADDVLPGPALARAIAAEPMIRDEIRKLYAGSAKPGAGGGDAENNK